MADTLPFASVESPVISEFVRETIRVAETTLLVQQDARRTSGCGKTQCVRFCGVLTGRGRGHQLLFECKVPWRAAEILLLAGPSDRSAKNVGASFAGLTVKQSGPFYDWHENGPGSAWYRLGRLQRCSTAQSPQCQKRKEVFHWQSTQECPVCECRGGAGLKSVHVIVYE